MAVLHLGKSTKSQSFTLLGLLGEKHIFSFNHCLRVFQLPWQRIVNAIESLAASHEVLAQKIEEDVERPLREYSSRNRDMQSMPNIQSDLAGLAKNLESTQKKVDKVREKGHKAADKVAVALSALDEANHQWESRAPIAFEHLQTADEGRLNHLRDVLTQLQTHDIDQTERNRQTAESCLNALLNIEIADEIKIFAAKVTDGRRIRSKRPEPVVPSPMTLPPPPRIPDDTASQKSGRSVRGQTPIAGKVIQPWSR
jgi:F-BAR domain only protein